MCFFCYSQSEIYDIGTEILCKTCFGHNSTHNERKSTTFWRIFIENFTQILNPLSKQDLKHFSKIDLLGFAAIVFYNFTILSAQKAPAGRLFVIPKTKYMSLGPKFYAKLVSAITRRRMNKNAQILNPLSKTKFKVLFKC